VQTPRALPRPFSAEDDVSRIRRRRFAPTIVALAAFMGITVGTGVGTLTVAASDEESPRSPRKASVALDPPLARTSAAVERARAEQQMNAAVFERAVFERAVLERAIAEKAKRDSIWDAIAACETQGKWGMRGSSYSGRPRLRERSLVRVRRARVRAQRRSGNREQQIVVAERIRARVGMRAWGCAKTVGVT
jgi:Transglycosylase-like domain